MSSFRWIGKPFIIPIQTSNEFSQWIGAPLEILDLGAGYQFYREDVSKGGGVVFGSPPPQVSKNDFSSDQSFKTWWRFESGQIINDSIGNNVLTNNGVNEDIYDGKDGSCCGVFGPNKYLFIYDNSLDSGFPLKSDDLQKKMTICAFFKVPSLPNASTYYPIISKVDYGNNTGSFWLGLNDSSCKFIWYYSGISNYTYTLGSISEDKWYFVVIYVDGIYKQFKYYLFDANNNGLVSFGSQTPEQQISVTSDPIMIGSDGIRYMPSGSKIDSVIVANRLLEIEEAASIVRTLYPTIGTSIYVDPYNGSNSNDGSSWNNSYLNFQTGGFFPNDVVLIRKSNETELNGTCTVTRDSTEVITSENLTDYLSQYDVLLFGQDEFLYLVSSVTPTKITLYNPYLGKSGTKTAKKIDKITNVSTSFSPPFDVTRATAPIIQFKFGVNHQTNQQDGFTLLSPTINNKVITSNTFYTKWSRLYAYQPDVLFGHASCALFEMCGQFRGNDSNVAPFMSIFDKCLFYNTSLVLGTKSLYYDCVSVRGDTGSQTRGPTKLGGQILRRCKFFYFSSINYFSNYNDSTCCLPIIYEDCNFYSNAEFFSFTANSIYKMLMILRNCKFNNFTFYFYRNMSKRLKIYSEHHNQKENEMLFYDIIPNFPDTGNIGFASSTSTSVAYKNTEGSISVDPGSYDGQFDDRLKFHFRAEGGKTYKITAWLMKNVSWQNAGSIKMIVDYMKGSINNAQWEEIIVEPEFEDIYNQFVPVTAIITPGFKQTVNIEFSFINSNNNARCWIDELSVKEV